MYLEVGFDAASEAIVEAFADRIEYASTGHVDSKTELQEALARTGRIVHYDVLEVDGPPHERRFVCAALIDGEQLGVGSGSTKKAAEQEAAAQALAELGVLGPVAPSGIRQSRIPRLDPVRSASGIPQKRNPAA